MTLDSLRLKTHNYLLENSWFYWILLTCILMSSTKSHNKHSLNVLIQHTQLINTKSYCSAGSVCPQAAYLGSNKWSYKTYFKQKFQGRNRYHFPKVKLSMPFWIYLIFIHIYICSIEPKLKRVGLIKSSPLSSTIYFLQRVWVLSYLPGALEWKVLNFTQLLTLVCDQCSSSMLWKFTESCLHCKQPSSTKQREVLIQARRL